MFCLCTNIAREVYKILCYVLSVFFIINQYHYSPLEIVYKPNDFTIF